LPGGQKIPPMGTPTLVKKPPARHTSRLPLQNDPTTLPPPPSALNRRLRRVLHLVRRRTAGSTPAQGPDLPFSSPKRGCRMMPDCAISQQRRIWGEKSVAGYNPSRLAVSKPQNRKTYHVKTLHISDRHVNLPREAELIELAWGDPL